MGPITFNTDDSDLNHVLGHILLEIQMFLRGRMVNIEVTLADEDFYAIIQRIQLEMADEIVVIRDDGDVNKALREMETFTIEFANAYPHPRNKVVLKKGGPNAASIPLPKGVEFTNPMLEG